MLPSKFPWQGRDLSTGLPDAVLPEMLLISQRTCWAQSESELIRDFFSRSALSNLSNSSQTSLQEPVGQKMTYSWWFNQLGVRFLFFPSLIQNSYTLKEENRELLSVSSKLVKNIRNVFDQWIANLLQKQRKWDRFLIFLSPYVLHFSKSGNFPGWKIRIIRLPVY